MSLTNRAIALYKAQYRYIEQAAPGSCFHNNTLTDIGAAHFPLIVPPRIKARTFFVGHHSQPMISPFKDIENNVVHTHHMSMLYLYTATLLSKFDNAIIALDKVLHTSHDS